MQDLRKITPKPVKTLIYTHGHPDHRGGAGAFKDTVEEIIAFAPQRPYRDLASWIDSLNEILTYDAIAVLPGHTKALIGKELIQKQIRTFKNALEFVLFETLECMNKGMTLQETAQHVKLPEEYKDKDYLGEYYGTVEWSVKSVYTGYVGWLDGDPAHLLPVSKEEYNQTILELIGKEQLLEKIKTCMASQSYQLALQLLEYIDAPTLKRECLQNRARQVTSANARHYYLESAKHL